jgi:glycerate kinase
MTRAATAVGWATSACAIADGGEGLLEALGGQTMSNTVTGPLGDQVIAEWRMISDRDGETTAVIEMARASGLALVGLGRQNDPVHATTKGTGELICHAIDAGAKTIIVGCGGSATTDGGRGALSAIGERLNGAGIVLRVACDVTTTFVDAAKIFGPQKGATPEQVAFLTDELISTAADYLDRYGVDIAQLPRTGAAGGLSGALASIGGELLSGVELIAERLGLDKLVEESDLVITGEGKLDATSLAGKVVGELVQRCRGRRPLAIIVGSSAINLDTDDHLDLNVISLTERFGEERARSDTLALVEQVTRELLSGFSHIGRL